MTKPAPVKKLGVERAVVAHEFREGPEGGLYMLLHYDCGGGSYRLAGKRPRVPKKATCVFHCEGEIGIHCAGCAAPSTAAAALAKWTLYRGAWWCPGCATIKLTRSTDGR